MTGAKLLKAVDSIKDQTLFLCQIRQEALRRTMFPLGGLTKSQVRHLAYEAGLDRIAKRKEVRVITFPEVSDLLDRSETPVEVSDRGMVCIAIANELYEILDGQNKS